MLGNPAPEYEELVLGYSLITAAKDSTRRRRRDFGGVSTIAAAAADGAPPHQLVSFTAINYCNIQYGLLWPDCILFHS